MVVRRVKLSLKASAAFVVSPPTIMPKAFASAVAAAKPARPLFNSGIMLAPARPNICMASAVFLVPSSMRENLSAKSGRRSFSGLMPPLASRKLTPSARNAWIAVCDPCAASMMVFASFPIDLSRVSALTSDSFAAYLNAESASTGTPMRCDVFSRSSKLLMAPFTPMAVAVAIPAIATLAMAPTRAIEAPKLPSLTEAFFSPVSNSAVSAPRMTRSAPITAPPADIFTYPSFLSPLHRTRH